MAADYWEGRTLALVPEVSLAKGTGNGLYRARGTEMELEDELESGCWVEPADHSFTECVSQSNG